MIFSHLNDALFILKILSDAREQPGRMPYELAAIDQLSARIERENISPSIAKPNPATRAAAARKGVATHV